jgi:hypothetical protein
MGFVVHHISSGWYDLACRHSLFSSQSESAALHAPVALEDLVDSILPWLCFTLVLFPELTGIDRLP